MEIMVRDRAITPIGLRVPNPSSQASAPQPSDSQLIALQFCEVGRVLLDAGQYLAALGQFEQALNHQPHDVESWYGRGEALAGLNRYEEALDSWDQAQELSGFVETRIWVQKATVLILMHQPEAALRCCNYALWLEPEHRQAWLFRGVALHCLGLFQEAERSYNRVTQPTRLNLPAQIRRFYDDLNPHQQAS